MGFEIMHFLILKCACSLHLYIPGYIIWLLVGYISSIHKLEAGNKKRLGKIFSPFCTCSSAC